MVKCEEGRLTIYRAEDLTGEMAEKATVGFGKYMQCISHTIRLRCKEVDR